MKKFLVSAFVMLTFWANAQTVPNKPTVPAGFAYQAVARQPNGSPYANVQKKVQFSIIQADTTGTLVWIERNDVITNSQGLFTTVVGRGTRTGG